MYSNQNTPSSSIVEDSTSNYNTCEISSGESGSGSGGESDSNQISPSAASANSSSSMSMRLPFTPYVSFRELYNAKKPYKCNVCRKRFKLKVYLKKHEMAPELGKHFSCVFCSKAFPERDKLRVHERIHTGEKPFVCNFCPMTFARKDKLKNHARSHTGEKPFVCGVCLKSFTRNDKLVMHQRTHSGERPFVCEVCTKAFSRRDHLKKHMRIHNSDSQANRYSHIQNKNEHAHLQSNSQCGRDDFKSEYVPRIPRIEKHEPGCYLTPAHDLLKAISASTGILSNQDQPPASSFSSHPAIVTSTNNVTPLRQPQPPLFSSASMSILNCSQESTSSQEQLQHTPTSMSSSDTNLQIPSQLNHNWKRNPSSSTWSTGWANPLSVPSYPVVYRKPENQEPMHNNQSLMQ